MKRVLFSLIILSMMVSGCAMTDSYIKMDYETGDRSPLSELESLKFHVEIQDDRPTHEQGVVAMKKSNFGKTGASFKLEEKVEDIFARAFSEELKYNNHTIVGTKSEADVWLQVRVKKYWADVKINFWDLEMIGIVNGAVSISERQGASLVADKHINTSISKSRQIAATGAYKAALNEALKEFLRSFSRDPKVLSALKQINAS